jgi:hypothetical protein
MADPTPTTAPTGEQPPAQTEAPKPAPPKQEASKPAPPAPAGKVEFTPEQQAAINALVQERIERDRATRQSEAQKTAEERIAELERKAAAADRAAVTAIIERAAAGTHDPAVVAKLVDLEGLTAQDPKTIEARVAEVLTANPWLVRPDGAPAVRNTPAPGVATGTGVKLLSREELDAMSVEELANDPEKLKLYMESLNALG